MEYSKYIRALQPKYERELKELKVISEEVIKINDKSHGNVITNGETKEKDMMHCVMES